MAHDLRMVKIAIAVAGGIASLAVAGGWLAIQSSARSGVVRPPVRELDLLLVRADVKWVRADRRRSAR